MMPSDEITMQVHSAYLERYVELAVKEIEAASTETELAAVKAKWIGKSSPIAADMRELFATPG